MNATQVKLSKFSKKPIDYPKGQNLKFQVLSWFAHDDHSNPDDPDSELAYKIYMFGNTMDSKSVCLLVNGYKPFFYIKIPDFLQKRWDNTCDLQFKTFLKSKVKFGFDNLQRVKKIDIYGFTNEKKENYLKLTFRNEASFKKAKYVLRPTIYSAGGTSSKEDKTRLPLIPGISSEKLEFKIYEHNIQSYIRFCHEIDIDMAGWVEVSEKDLISPEDTFSKCQIEFSTKWNNVKRYNEVKNSNFVVASFDIETLPEDRRSFPDANKKNDIVFQIGTTFYNHGTKEYTKHITTMGNTKEKHLFKKVPDVVFHVVETEKEMIETWVRIIAEVSPDILTGYNIYNFDWKYIQTRARINKCEDFLQQKLSKLVIIPAEFKKDRLSSSAYGDNVMTYYDIPGMTNIDLFFTIKRDHKLESYSLDNVSSHFLNDNKVDMPYEEMFRKYDGTTADRIEISIYCAQDTFLVIKLINRLSIISNNISMANKTKIPLLFVETKGQQIKVFSQLLAKTITTDYIVPTVHYGTANEDSFTGATVLTAKPGAYYVPISGLDFASLYPAIMISNNLCYSTIVLNDKYKNIAGIDYKTVEWTDTEGIECQATYVQSKKGILPELLEELWKERKSVKKQMKTEKDPAVYDVLNGVQLAIKVSMNSIYGFTGATYGKLSEKKIASSVTALGRESIQQAKHYAELWYDCEVKYGDSVTDYTPVYLKINDKLVITEMGQVENYSSTTWKHMENKLNEPTDKEYISFHNQNIYTWSDKGWTKLETLIRHKLHSSKKIIRVLTHTGIVDTTDDHSLLLENEEIISPKEINIGDKLLHKSLPNSPTETNKITHDEAMIYGFFFGDGSCGFYNCESGNKASWALNNGDYQLLEKYKIMCEKIYPQFKWNILETIKSSGVYKLVPNGGDYGSITHFIKEYRNKTYLKKAKIIPDDIINGDHEARTAFIQGLYDADGCKNKTGTIRIDQKNQISMAQIKWLLDQLGFNTSLNTREDKPNIFRVNGSNATQRKPATKIKKFYEIPDYQGFVYDFTTESHHFSAGIGNIVVHNTDSIYVEFKTGLEGKAHFDKVFEISEEAADRISATFKKPMELEFEKVMYPFLIMSKKRYASVIWTNTEKHDYVDYKGLQVKRRDSCQYVRKNGEKLFEELLLKDIYNFDFNSNAKNIQIAVESAKNCITKLLNGQVPMNELILSRALKENYKNINVPHVALCRKMKERDPNNVPQVGDRVKYVFAETGGPVKTQADLVEDPDYVLKNGISLNYFYYYEHQLKSMIETIFSILPIDQSLIFSVSDSYKPIVRKWASKVAKELALANELTLDDFPDILKVKKDDILKLVKARKVN